MTPSEMSAEELQCLLEQFFTQANEIGDIWASSCCECDYENFDDFKSSNDLEYFEQDDFCSVLKEVSKCVYKIVIGEENVDICNVFHNSSIDPKKFILIIWYFLENLRKEQCNKVDFDNTINVASIYLGLCSLKGTYTIKLYQEALFNRCLKIIRTCCHKIILGNLTAKKAHKKKSAVNEDQDGGGEDFESVNIGLKKAEEYLKTLSTMLYAFISNVNFPVEEECLMKAMEAIEEFGRLGCETKQTTSVESKINIKQFERLDKFVDIYCAFLYTMVNNKLKTWQKMVYARLIRPRCALLPYEDEGTKSSKISTERKRAGDISANFMIKRIESNTSCFEMKLIRSVMTMIFYECPDLQEFRTNIASFLLKLLQALPYDYQYDFVQTVDIMARSRHAGARLLAIDLSISLIDNFDFSKEDPGELSDKLEEHEQDKDADDSEDEMPEEQDDGEEEDEESSGRDQAKKSKKTSRVKAEDALYRIIYVACLEKTASARLHGASSLRKLLMSSRHNEAFVKSCELMNNKLDEEFGEIDVDLNESLGKKNEFMQEEEEQIIRKFKKLNMMNKGETKIETDVVYGLVRRLASDEKAPVRKASCGVVFEYLKRCQEEEKFEKMMKVLETMCRDKTISVRKVAGESINDLMMENEIPFKKILSSIWLNSLLQMLDDCEADVQEHARKLIMSVLAPLFESPSELTWSLLETIESKNDQRNYFMSVLKEAASEKLVKVNVLDTMKTFIDNEQYGPCPWMVFSQLSVVFNKNGDYTARKLLTFDLSGSSTLVKYMAHVVVNNLKWINNDLKEDLLKYLINTIRLYRLHSSHSKDIYHLIGRLIDGIGENARGKNKFLEYSREILDDCFDNIVKSFNIFKNKEEWEIKSEEIETRLTLLLNISSEVFLYCPSLVPKYERLAKTLSLIVNSSDQNNTQEVNPHVQALSANTNRPPTQMSDLPMSQRAIPIMMHREGDGVLFSENIRAVSVVTLGNIILAHDKMLKLMPMFVKQLQKNPSHQVRNNIVIAIGDICERYKTDRYAPTLASCLCDPSVIVKRHAINQIARMVSSSIFRFSGEVMIRIVLAILDANESVRNDAKLYIREVLQYDIPDFFMKYFVQYMIYLTQAKRVVNVNSKEEGELSMGGGNALARSSRIAIYNFMIESLDDKNRFLVKKDICIKIINPIVNGEFDFGEDNVYCLLEDALLIMSSSEMQVKMEVGKNENAMDEPPAEVLNAATEMVKIVYLQNYIDHIMPSILNLREFLNDHMSPLQRKCQLAIRMICLENKNDLDSLLKDNKQLKDEMLFEMQRVKQRTEEANRILDQQIKKIIEIKKQQQAQMEIEAESHHDEHSNTPGTPKSTMKSIGTPKTARPLSPKTVKKIRKSVGNLIRDNETALKPPSLNETNQICENEDIVAPEAIEIQWKEPRAVEEEKRMNESRREEHAENVSTAENATGQNAAANSSRIVQNEENGIEVADDVVIASCVPNTDEVRLEEAAQNAPESNDVDEIEDLENIPIQANRKQSILPSDIQENDAKRLKIDRKTRGQTPLNFDESFLMNGRFCSTPIANDENPAEVTFGLNMSKIEVRKGRRTIRKTMAEILETEEDGE